MSFLNLSAAEFFGVLVAVSLLVSSLYFLEKAKSRRVVSTLRFWQGTGSANAQKRKARVHDLPSLLLQLAALLLLLLAIADVQWHTARTTPLNHVLLVDASAASAGSVLPEEKRLAAAYLNSLPAGSRAMVVETGGLVVPRNAFSTGQESWREALARVQTTDAALDLGSALRFADQARHWPDGRSGEVVYIGPARVPEAQTSSIPALRVIPVTDAGVGIILTQFTAARSSEPGSWTANLGLRNAAPTPQSATVDLQFGVTHFAPRRVVLRSGAATELHYEFTATAAGLLQLRLETVNGRGQHASLALGQNGTVSIVAVTRRAALLDSLLHTNPRFLVRYVSPGEYNPSVVSDAIVFDQFAPATAPGSAVRAALWMDPPVIDSPFAVQRTTVDQSISDWAKDPELAAGLRSNDVRIPGPAHIFEAAPGLETIASTAAGSVIVAASPQSGRQAAIGFDLLRPELRFDATTPLLMANLLHWLVPAAFASEEVRCVPPGLQHVSLEPSEYAATIQVQDERGRNVPWTLHDGVLQFYGERQALMRVHTASHTRELSVNLPAPVEAVWRPQGQYAIGVPRTGTLAATQFLWWPVFASLAALLLAIEWFVYGRAARPRRLARLSLKLAALAVLFTALSTPSLRIPLTRVAVAALVDGSASVSKSDTDRAAEVVRKLKAAADSNLVVALPFAQSVGGRISVLHTNIENALLQGLAALPQGFTPRLLLFSDGNQNQGSSARAAATLARAGVPLDVVPLGTTNGLHVVAVEMQKQAYSGEQVPLTVVLDSASPGSGTLSLAVEGHTLATEAVSIRSGRTTLAAHVRLKADGPVVLTGTLALTPSGASARFDRVVQLQRAKALYLSQDEPSADVNFLSALSSAQLDVSRDPALILAGLQQTQLVVLNNLDLNSFSLPQKESLERYVAAGGGLLIISGEHEVYKEARQMDVLDRALPAKLGPPRNPEGICVALILDKSSSMEGRKIELARLSAIGVVDNLKPKDTIGVLIFDNSYQWAVPMQKAIDKISMQRLISGITPDGGTQIAPALMEAYHKVMRVESAYKHIVLLTDGISEEGDSLDLAREANAHGVTISTVGLGQDVNRSYLEKVAGASGGKSYFLNNPQGLEQILLKDVKDYGGTTAVEKPLLPQIKHKAEILNGVDLEHAPALRGYVRYEAKTQSETLLTIDPEKNDPLFVRWQYGLGRVGIWSSDAKSRWAEAWITWPGFDSFWGNVARDLLDRQRSTEATAGIDASTGELEVTYHLREQREVPPLFVFGPDSFVAPVPLQKTGAGTFRGAVPLAARTGLFTIRPITETAWIPEVGTYRPDAELRDTAANEPLLRMLADSTGGSYRPDVATEFLVPGKGLTRKLELWPALLALVLVLTLAELVTRKWQSLIAWLASSKKSHELASV